MEFSIKPGFGHAPVSPHSADRYLERLRCLFLIQAPEKAQLHDAGLSLVQLLQSVPRLVESHEIRAALAVNVVGLQQRDLHAAASTLLPSVRAGEIYEDMSHDLRRKSKEMRAVLPLDVLPIDQ